VAVAYEARETGFRKTLTSSAVYVATMAAVATYATDGKEGTISTVMSSIVYVSYNNDKDWNWFRVVPQ